MESFAIPSLQKIEDSDPDECVIATNVEHGKLSGTTARIFAADNMVSEKLEGNVKGVKSGDPKYKDIPLTNMRETIAKRLSFSKQTIPHYYLTSEITMDEILKLVVF